MTLSQRKKVEDKFTRDGFVSRNWCLRQYISRLSALIYDLREDGWQIESFTGKELGLSEKNEGNHYYILSEYVFKDMFGTHIKPRTMIDNKEEIVIGN